MNRKNRLTLMALTAILIAMGSAGPAGAGTFTIPQDKLLAESEFGSPGAWGAATWTRTDFGPGISVDFAFTGLDGGTGIKDDFPVGDFYGQTGGAPYYGDFTNMSGYSLQVENLDDKAIAVKVFIGTGTTGTSGTPPSDPSNDTFWAGPQVTLGPGDVAILSLDFNESEAWNISDNKIPHTGGGESWLNGGIYSINDYDRGDVTAIGFEVADPVGDNPNGTLRFTPRSMAHVAPGDPSPATVGCGQDANVAFGYSPDSETTALKGYSIRVRAGSEVSFDDTDITVNILPSGTDPDDTFSQIITNGVNDYTVDYAVLGATTGIITEEDLFDIDFEGASTGFAGVWMETVVLRDLLNEDIAVHYTDSTTIIVDCTVPNDPALNAEPAYTAGTSNTVSWSDESGSGAAEYYAECATDAGFASLFGNSGWISGTSHEFTGLSDGQIYYYRVKCRNALENESGWSGSEFSTQDDTAPASSADALSAYHTALTFDVAYTANDGGSGVASVELFYDVDGGGYASYGSFSSSPISFTAAGDGTYSFYTVATDDVGNVEDAPATPPDASTIVDTAAPTGSFVINSDDTYTTDTAVTLNCSVSEASEMRFSNDSGTSWPDGWVAYAAISAWTLTSGDGTKTVTGEFRDAAGNVLGPLTDDITLDTGLPGAVADIAASAQHEEVLVTWDDPGDPDLDELEIWRGLWYESVGDGSVYPEYDDHADETIPTRPATRAAADASDEWEWAGTVALGTQTFTDAIVDRGVYYYEVFAKDTAGNYGPYASANDRATNYWLGDVSDGTYGQYDGLVTLADVTVLATYYGQSFGVGDLQCEMDIGPTDDHGGYGIPLTDQTVNFEDLMIISLTFGYVAPLPLQDKGTEYVSLEWRRLDDTHYALQLVEPCLNLKGLRLWAPLSSSTTVTLSKGELLEQQAGNTFLANDEHAGLDAGLAVLGTDVCILGQGELLRLELSAPMDLLPEGFVARSIDNEELEVRIEATDTPEIPLHFRISQNYPNPFNPKTTIRLDLPEAEDVRMIVFTPDGRQVAVLQDGVLPAGSHEIHWMGGDLHGGEACSGVYFCRIEAGDRTEIRKLLMIK